LGDRCRPATFFIIDEAGMTDTLSLDTAVQFAVDRGARVRLIGVSRLRVRLLTKMHPLSGWSVVIDRGQRCRER